MMNGLKPNGLPRGAPNFLASVTSVEEARLALLGGADIIDCKDPTSGALGALEPATIKAIVDAIATRVPVSATIGDLPSDGDIMVKAARRIAATGADIVKAGFFGDTDAQPAIVALGQADLGSAKRFAVLMADRAPDLTLLPVLADAGFMGVMLDTADKASGSLPDVLDADKLATFVRSARAHGLVCGLAGSLRLPHIGNLVALYPDVIGFRGALCTGDRTTALDLLSVAVVRSRIDAAFDSQRPQIASTAERSIA